MFAKIREIYYKLAAIITKEEIIIGSSGYKLTPGNNGESCICNGKSKNIFGRKIESCCDECDYLMCCLPHACENCGKSQICPRQKNDWQMRRRCVIFNIYRLWRRVSRSGSVWRERKCHRLEAFLQTPHLNFNAGAFREKRLFAVLSGTWRCVKAQKERRAFLRIRVVPRVFLVP